MVISINACADKPASVVQLQTSHATGSTPPKPTYTGAATSRVVNRTLCVAVRCRSQTWWACASTYATPSAPLAHPNQPFAAHLKRRCSPVAALPSTRQAPACCPHHPTCSTQSRCWSVNGDQPQSKRRESRRSGATCYTTPHSQHAVQPRLNGCSCARSGKTDYLQRQSDFAVDMVCM